MPSSVDMKEPTVSQQLIKALTNTCFATFVLVVLILTVIAVTYQPPDPFLDTGRAITQALTSSVKNGTFVNDDSVIRTGEDFQGVSALAPEAAVAITSQDVFALVESLAGPVNNCDSQNKHINCSDPDVLSAIIAYNLEHFPNLNFFAYQFPVQGEEENQCDVSWRFRSKKEKSWRMYRDFRRFTLQLHQSCNHSVISSLGWHSGKNAKPLHHNRSSAFHGRTHESRSATLSSSRNATEMEELEVIKDDVSVEPWPKTAFRNRRYLYYSRGGDHCKSMNHYLWSFLCALGEAKYLNRTLVMDLDFCLSGSNNPGHGDEDGKDFRFYFDYAHLRDSASVIEQKHFLKEWTRWNRNHPSDAIIAKEIDDFRVTPMELRKDRSSAIILRNFKLQEPDNYWFRVCEGETEKVIQRPWHLLWKSKRIMDIVNAICGQMEWNFDVVHVVRGHKARNKELWPNLDADTSVDSLIEKLRDQVDVSRNVYIATNELEPGYFDQLKQVYKHAYLLDDFSRLWAENSLWYNQTLALTKGQPVEFDGYMRLEVDTEVMYRGKKKFETFGFLTKDCKGGANTC